MANTVFVGLSGGVDSATSAALLKEQGYSVVGAFIKIWQPEFLECTWAKDRLDAMRVSAALDIPFMEVDLSQEYKDSVIREMLASYEAGETPNPDTVCNSAIKFGAFAEWARSQGADMLATGHHARIRKTFGSAELVRGKDPDKDQSYFLYGLDKRDLQRAFFPVGEMTKVEVRAKARRFNLPVHDKPDSQGLCFVGDVSMHEFLQRYLTLQPGPVLDGDGREIGTHDGAALYTIGQRHGFKVSGAALAGQAGKPRYIVAVDAKQNTVTVSPERTDAARTNVRVRDVHWIGEPPAMPAPLLAQARYREEPVAITFTRDGDGGMVTFDKPHIAAPGQAIVFYDGDTCLGGAIISKEKHVRASSVHSATKAAHKAVQ